MKDTDSAELGNPRQPQHRWIVFLCALLGAGAGFALSFAPFGMDAFESHIVTRAYDDEQGRIHVETVGLASIWVFGVKVFSEERPEWDFDLSDRWRRYCQLFAAALTVVGLIVGVGLGLCVQRLTQRRRPGSIGIQVPQEANSVSVQSPSV